MTCSFLWPLSLVAAQAALPSAELAVELQSSAVRALRAVETAPGGGLVLRGFRMGPYDGAPEEQARAFLAAHGAQLGLDPEAWGLSQVRSWRGRQRVRLQQLHRDVPVAGGSLVLSLEDGAVVALHAAPWSDLRADPRPAFGPQRAVELARELLGGPLRDGIHAQLMVEPDARGGVLVYRVQLQTQQPMAFWRVTLDAHSGALRRVADMRSHALAEVYEHNPINSDLVEVELPLVQGEVLESDIAEVYSLYFEGDQAMMTQLASADEQGDFYYSPDDDEPVYDDPFAEVNAYWHVAAIHQWFEEVHGHVFGGPATVMCNYRESPDSGYDNAWFSKSYGGDYVIALGQGAVDVAYDSDVIQHEFGHGIVDDLCDVNAELDYPVSFDQYGLHPAPHGINEGMADYWSSTYAGDPHSAEYFGSAFGLAALRELENQNTTPEDVLGEPHHDGLIVGGTCWEIRELLGAEVADELIYGALGSLSTTPTFLEYAEAIAEAGAVLAEDGLLDEGQLQDLDAILEVRGWYRCGRAIELQDGEVEQGIFLGADLLSGYIGASACTLARSFEEGLLFPLPFQYALQLPEEGQVEAVEISIRLEAYADGDSLGEDDLQYALYLRRDELVTFEEYNLQQLIGMDYTLLSGVVDYDMVVDEQPSFVRITGADMALEPGSVIHLDLAGMNCPATSYEISAQLVMAEEEEEGGCRCGAVGGVRGVWLGLVALLGLGRRRRG